MVSEDVILTGLYKILNVTTVTDSIEGNIYKGEKPLNRQYEDVVIGLLLNQQGANDKLQTGIININFFCKESTYHTRDSTLLTTVTNNILTSLNLENGMGSNTLFHYRLDSKKTFRDSDDPEMFYSNIKLEFSYKNN